MANYTSAEVQAAVEKVVRSTVRNTTGALGQRQVETSFSDLQEAAAGVYILYYNALFYTIYLGTTRLTDAAETQAQTLSALIDAVSATDRLVTPVTDISPIANAKAALLELEGAVTNRSQGFSDITKVPAFRRYAQNLANFLTQNGGNLKGTTIDTEEGSETYGQAVSGITDTPSGARARIPALVRQLKDQHDELIRRVKLLAGAFEDFGSMNLPQVAAQGVISRARQVLDSRYAEMAALNENERLENLRAVVLDLLTQQPIVEQYGAAKTPSQYVTTRGSAVAYSDRTHPATPASLVALTAGPYPTTSTSHVLNITLDGSTSIAYPLPISMVAELQGILTAPFNIDSTNNQLTILFGNPDGAPARYQVTLPTGLHSAQTLAVAVTVALGGSALVCEAVFSPLKYQSAVFVTSLGGNTARFLVMAGSLLGLGVDDTCEVDILSGPDAGTTWAVTAVDPAGLYIEATGSAPVTPVGLPDGVDIKVGPANRALRLRDTNEALSVGQRRAIQLPVTGGVGDLSAATLGWYPGAYARSRPVAAKDIAENIAASSTVMTASHSFSPTLYTGIARSSTTDAGMVVLSKFQGSGTITGGLVAVFTGAGDFDVRLGDILVVRGSSTPDDVNKSGVVTEVMVYAGPTTAVHVTFFNTTVTAGNVDVEIGPNAPFGAGDVLNILDGSNKGRYVVREDREVGTACPLEVLLESALPAPKDGASPVSLYVDLGQESVVFKSRSVLNSSSVAVTGGNAAALFFSALPATAAGTTPYLRFESFPSGAQVGDVIQIFQTDYSVVTRQFDIKALEQGTRLVKVSPDFEVTANYSFAFDTTPPFGRIRVSKVADYNTLKSRLNAWLALPPQQPTYWRNLTALLSPLLSNSNPTAQQVHDASNLLLQMLEELTDSGASLTAADDTKTLRYALVEYVAPAEEPVDTLLTTFRHKGADRAIDLLLEGQFSVFFGLDSDGVSYSGQLLSSLRTMMREDLPVRKFDRGRSAQTLIGQTQEQKDFEFNADDADSPNQPDIPVGSAVVSPGASY